MMSLLPLNLSLPLSAFPDPPQKPSKSKWPKPLDGAIQPQKTLQSTVQSCNLKEPPLIIQETLFATRNIFEKPFLTPRPFKNK